MEKRNVTSVMALIIFVGIGFFLYMRMDRRIDRTVKQYQDTRLMMGSYVNVDVCYEPDREADLVFLFHNLWGRLQEIDSLMSDYVEGSDVTRINISTDAPTIVKPETYRVIEDAFAFNKSTEGAFDITVKPLMTLWKNAARWGRVPSAEELQKVLDDVGPLNFNLLGLNRVQRINKGAQIDLGGIATGYAVDEAVEILKQQGFSRFLIDAAGDIYASGQNCEGRPWSIGVRDPRNKEALVGVLALSECAVTTSGDYEKYFEIDGKRWSHIINPVTGFPADRVASATVIAPTTIEADVLATVLCVLGEKKGIAHIDALGDGYAGFLIELDQNGELKKFPSKRYQNYLRR